MERTDLIARESIRDLLARYTWAADRGRMGEVARCFAAEGVLDLGEHGGRWSGREAIRSELDRVLGRVAEAARPAPAAASSTASGVGRPEGGHPGGGSAPPVRHHVSSVSISLDSHAAATVRSYFLVLTTVGVDHWGRYRDQVVETAPGDEWLFQERVVIVDGRAPDSLMVSSHA